MDVSSRNKQAGKAEEKKSLYTSFSDFLRKYRVAIIGIFSAIVLAFVALVVIDAVQEGAATASTARVEKLLDVYSSYKGETDSAKKAELEKSIFSSVEEIAKKWPRLFASQRARSISARVYESKEDWASAEREWIAAADALPSSYMAPLALQNAAAAAEEQGADSRAIEYYKRLIARYDSATIGLVHAYFALGRLYENSRDYASAVENYKKIVSTWPDSDWTKLATDRILALKAKGLAQ